MALNFNQYATEGNTFLKNYTKEMNLGNDREKGGRILSAILHALRDVIPVEESLQLISQLPMFLKAVYVNGWSIKKERPKIKHMAQFINLVKKHDGPSAINDFEYNDELAQQYIDTTFILLRKFISLGEMEDIRDGLPKDLKSMVYLNIMF